MPHSTPVLARLRRRFAVGVTLVALVFGGQLATAAPALGIEHPCNCGGGGGGGSDYISLTGALPADIVIGVPMTAQFTAVGTPPYTFTATLPAGLSIDGNGLVSGTPTGPAEFFSGVVQVSDTRTFNYVYVLTTVNQRPGFTGATSATVPTAAAASVQVGVAGYPAPSVTVTSGALPTGLTISASGLITGTPADASVGTYTLSLLAQNAFGSSTSTFAITVAETRPPLVTAHPTPRTVQAGASATFTASAMRANSVQWERSTGGGVWAAIPGATASTYAVTASKADQASSYRAVFTGTGGTAASGAALLSVRYAPTVTSAASTAFVAGRPTSFTISTDGNPAGSISATGLESWMTLTDNGNGTATLAGTPPLDDAGNTIELALSVGNLVGTTSTQLAVTVQSVPTVGTSPAPTVVTPGSIFTFTAAADGGFPAPTAQWERSSDGVTYTPIPGATATSYLGLASVGDNGSRYRVVFTNAAGTATSSPALLRVGTAPVFTSAPSAGFAEGVFGSVTITASGTPLPTIATSGLPAWLTISNSTAGTATLSGTPPVGSADLSLWLTATNGFDPDATQAFALAIHRSAVFSSGSTATLTQGEAGSFTVTTEAGFPAARALSYTGTLPAGVEFVDNGDGTATLGGTPLAGTGGVVTLRIFATPTAGVAAPVAQDVTLTILERPSISSPDRALFAVGSPVSFTVHTAAGYPAVTTLTSTALPAGLDLVDNGDGTATISGTPLASAAGASSFAITASNGVGDGTSQTFTATVNATPVFTTAYTTAFDQGDATTFVVRTSGGFPVATGITATGALPTGVTFVDNGDGTATLSGTPAAASGGSYPITLTATPIGGTTAARTQSLVLVVNELPAFTSADHVTARVGESVDFAVGTNAGYPVSRALAVVGALPDGLVFDDNGDGTGRITGTPLSGTEGLTTVTIAADNGLATTSTQSFTIAVHVSPVFTAADASSFRVGEPGTFTVGTGAGFPAATGVAAAGTLPNGVTFADNGDGTATLSGTPAAGTGGVYPLVLTAASVGGSSAPSTQAFTLTVFEAATVTSAATLRFDRDFLSTFEVSTTAGYPAATTITVTGDLPAGIGFSDFGDGSAGIGGVPTETGVFGLTVTASNAEVSSSQQLWLTVVGTPILQPIADPTVTAGVAVSIPISARGGYPAGTVVTIDGALPDGLEFTETGGGTATIAGSAAPGTEGDYPVTVRADNGVGTGAAQALTVTVVAAPVVPLPTTLPLWSAALLGVPDTATVNDAIDVRGSGFAPGSTVTFGIYSTPRQLGETTADALGSFSARLRLPADLTGAHTVVAIGTAADGSRLVLASPVQIAAAKPAAVRQAALASTGADVTQALWLAGLLGLAGLVLARAGSRAARGRARA